MTRIGSFNNGVRWLAALLLLSAVFTTQSRYLGPSSGRAAELSWRAGVPGVPWLSARCTVAPGAGDCAQWAYHWHPAGSVCLLAGIGIAGLLLRRRRDATAAGPLTHPRSAA